MPELTREEQEIIKGILEAAHAKRLPTSGTGVTKEGNAYVLSVTVNQHDDPLRRSKAMYDVASALCPDADLSAPMLKRGQYEHSDSLLTQQLPQEVLNIDRVQAARLAAQLVEDLGSRISRDHDRDPSATMQHMHMTVRTINGLAGSQLAPYIIIETNISESVEARSFRAKLAGAVYDPAMQQSSPLDGSEDEFAKLKGKVIHGRADSGQPYFIAMLLDDPAAVPVFEKFCQHHLDAIEQPYRDAMMKQRVNSKALEANIVEALKRLYEVMDITIAKEQVPSLISVGFNVDVVTKPERARELQQKLTQVVGAATKDIMPMPYLNATFHPVRENHGKFTVALAAEGDKEQALKFNIHPTAEPANSSNAVDRNMGDIDLTKLLQVLEKATAIATADPNMRVSRGR